MNTDNALFAGDLDELLTNTVNSINKINAAGHALQHENKMLHSLRRQIEINAASKLEVMTAWERPQPTPASEARRDSLAYELSLALPRFIEERKAITNAGG